MVASAKRVRITPRDRKGGSMGEILRTRKRHRSDYMKVRNNCEGKDCNISVLQVEDDIEFLVVNKKAKVCEDDSSEDRSSPDLMDQIKDIKLDSDDAKPVKVETQNVQLEAKQPEEKPTEDTREMNRRSPNGFLLPDPLPR